MPVNSKGGRLKPLWNGIKRHAADVLSLDRLDGRFKVLAVNYLFLMTYYTVETVYINTLLYRVDPNISIVIYYRAVNYLVTAAAMNAAAYLAHFRSPVTVIRLGGHAYLLMYVVLFFGMNHMRVWMVPVAVLSGMGAGFYWSGHNILLTHYTDRRNRIIGVSVTGIIQGVMTLLVPLVSGFVITLLPGNTGYRVLFGLCMGAVLAQAYYQKNLSPIAQKRRRSELSLACKLVWKKIDCKLMLAFEFVRGFRDGTFLFFLNLLLFQIITEEYLVGINTFLTGAFAIIGSWVYGRLVAPSTRARFTVLSTTVLLGFCAMLFLKLSAFTVMLFSALNAFLALFIQYSCNNASYDVFGQNEATRQAMGELIGFRELAIELGRVTGMAVVLAFPRTRTGTIQAMCLLTAAQYLAGLLLWMGERLQGRKKGKKASLARADAQ